MRTVSLVLCCALMLLTVIGCQESTTGTPGAPVATTEDEYAAYDAMIAEDQAQTAADSEAATGEAGQ